MISILLIWLPLLSDCHIYMSATYALLYVHLMYIELTVDLWWSTRLPHSLNILYCSMIDCSTTSWQLLEYNWKSIAWAIHVRTICSDDKEHQAQRDRQSGVRPWKSFVASLSTTSHVSETYFPASSYNDVQNTIWTLSHKYRNRCLNTKMHIICFAHFRCPHRRPFFRHAFTLPLTGQQLHLNKSPDWSHITVFTTTNSLFPS